MKSHKFLASIKRVNEIIEKNFNSAYKNITKPRNGVNFDVDGGGLGVEKLIVNTERELVIPGGVAVALIVDPGCAFAVRVDPCEGVGAEGFADGG